MIPLSDKNPAHTLPVVTIALIVTCVLVFLWQYSHDAGGQQLIVYRLGTIPATFTGTAQLTPEVLFIPAWSTMFTSMFLHGGWMHLGGNMLYLWIFGNNIEESMGHLRFILFYILCGIVAVLTHALLNPESTIPMVGASGAISGVLGAYLLLFPRVKVLILIPLGFLTQLVEIKAMWVLAFWFGLQLVSQFFTDSSQGGVAFSAHIGGFVAGLVLIPFFKYTNVPLQFPFGREPKRNQYRA